MFSFVSNWIASPARRSGWILLVAASCFFCELTAGAASLVVKTNTAGVTPTILGYNSGHFYPGSNTREWWRYSGVNGARVFINPNDIEPTAGTTSGGVTSQTTYSNRLAAVRANPTSGTYIGWSFTNNYGSTLSGGNNIVPNYAFAALRQLGVQLAVNITSSFSLASATDWANKWKIWRHYYAQAFYLARTFDVQRYQMYNEPNYGTTPSISPSEFLLQLQVVSDAVQSAVADVNILYGKSLTPLVLAPVTSGSADGSYAGYGDLVVTNRHLNQYGVVDTNFSLIQKYDYHQYDATPSGFGSSLFLLVNDLFGAMQPETLLPVMASEFNIYSGSTYDGLTNNDLDTLTDYARFGDVADKLVGSTINEAYCFKFSQTISSSSGNPTKNGMHYVENTTSPYNIGGITLAGEVWRLFNKGMGAGQNRFGVVSAPALSTYQLSFDPAANRYYIFAVNNSASAVDWTANLTAWKIPTNNLVQVEEVSESCYGAVKFMTNVSAAGLAGGLQPPYSVWLLTIPVWAQPPVQTIVATDDTMVRDQIYTNNFSTNPTVLVQNSSTIRSNRYAGLLKFHLPAGFKTNNLQLAVLSLHAASSVGASNSQANVYGLAGTNWSEASVNWTNAPNLKHGVSAGSGITANFVLGVGDWTNSSTPIANSARLLGQVVADTNYTERLVDVTDFIKSATNADVSFLLAREVRFAGDLASQDGIAISSTEANTTNAPQLKFVFNQPPAFSGALNYSNRALTLNFSGVAGQSFSIQANTNLASTNWLNLLTTNLPAASWSYTDTLATNFSARYYRTYSP